MEWPDILFQSETDCMSFILDVALMFVYCIPCFSSWDLILLLRNESYSLVHFFSIRVIQQMFTLFFCFVCFFGFMFIYLFVRFSGEGFGG